MIVKIKEHTINIIKKLLFLLILFISNFSIAEELYTKKEILLIKRAINEADSHNWYRALETARQIKDPLVEKAIYWMMVRQNKSKDSFAKLAKLHNETKDWPFANEIRQKVEESITIITPKKEVLKWFELYPPVTCTGHKKYISYIQNIASYQNKLATEVQHIWHNCSFDLADRNKFLKKYQSFINSNDHKIRLDNLIWSSRLSEALRDITLVNVKDQKILKTRISVLGDNQLRSLTYEEQKDSGIIYAQLLVAQKQDNKNKIIHYLKQIANKQLSHYHCWWPVIKKEIRSLLENKEYKLAYQLTSNHNNLDHAHISESEWQAGWIALRFLNDPQTAIKHFNNMAKICKLPVSLARMNYWIARSYEKLGNTEEAKKYYIKAAHFENTFYGQLSAAKIYHNQILPLPTAGMKITHNDVANFHKNIYAKLALIYSFHKNYAISHKFIAESVKHASSHGEIVLISQIGDLINNTALSVKAAKDASYKNIILLKTGYPRIEIGKPNNVNPAFIHSLIRQESLFSNTGLVSSAGAMGLMQIMPSTGKEIAKSIGDRFDKNQLLRNHKYNLKLGVTYLNQLSSRLSGSYILTAASYNAGELNVRKWINRFGDPRSFNNVDDVVDWIELITFEETRNYVHRILESMQIYKPLLQQRKSYSPSIDLDLLKK